MTTRKVPSPAHRADLTLARRVERQIGRVFSSHESVATAEAIAAYAEAVGETGAVQDGSGPPHPVRRIPPTFLFTLGIAKPRPFEVYDELGIDQARILHAEQSFTFLAPVVAGQRLTFTPHLDGVGEKRDGALLLVTVTTAVTDPTSRAIAELGTVIAVRQAMSAGAPARAVRGGAGAPASIKPVIAMPPITRETLARFAAASGDGNPLHLDSAAARAAGFDDVIAHGMLIAAYAGRAVEQWFPGRAIARFATRFTGITRLGDVVTLSLADGDPATDPRRFIVSAHDHRGEAKLRSEVIFTA